MTVTFDATHSVRANLDWLVTTKGAHHLAVIKLNQPTLHKRLRTLPWADVPAAELTRDHGHGRDETRTLKAVTVIDLDFPHAAQALKISRWRRQKHRPTSRGTVYAVTDLTAEQATGADLARLARQHWHIEVKNHYLRDVTFGEDTNTTRTGHAPTNLATIRSAVINTLREAGYPLIPEGRRNHTTPTEATKLHGLA